MSLADITIKYEQTTKKEDLVRTIRRDYQPIYENMLKKRGINTGQLFFGPFDWDKDVIALGPGNTYHRLTSLNKTNKTF